MNAVSTNYRQLDPSEVATVAAQCAEAWLDPAIPERQYEQCTKRELEAFFDGMSVAPFDALVKLLLRIGSRHSMSLLDVGASSAYYNGVLNIAGFNFQYHGIDFSPAFKELAVRLYPGIAFDVADARNLPFHDDFFDIVLNSACIMHCLEYEQVIRETARVSSKYVIFHRTPITTGPTSYWLKEAYQVPCLEIWFNENELLDLFDKCRLALLHSVDVFRDGNFSHRSYLLRKVSESERRMELA